jgi:hypothetical protein
LACAIAACAGPPPAAPPAPSPPAAPPAPADDPDGAWRTVPVVALEAPPWEETTADSLARPAAVVPRLSRLLEASNEITDDDAWLERNGFGRPGAGSPTRPLPTFYRDEPRARVIEQMGWTLGVYGAIGQGRYLLAVSDSSRRLAFDFAAYHIAPVAGGEAWPQDLLWAAISDHRLYVSHAHPTYAESTGGMNGYVTALDLEDGALLWRSRPLVANARTFEVVDDVVVAGYGFTAEPDFLYVIDRFRGGVLQEAAVRTAPTWIIRRDRRLFVRSYDADYVYALL